MKAYTKQMHVQASSQTDILAQDYSQFSHGITKSYMQLQKTQAEKIELEKHFLSIKQQKEQLTQNLQTFEAENSYLKQQQQLLNSQNKKQQDSIQTYRTLIDNLKENELKQSQMNIQLREQLENKEQDKHLQREKIEQIENNLKKLEEEKQQLSSELQKNQEKNLCEICYSNPKSSILLPCGHFKYCQDCIHELKKQICPHCRTPIQDIKKAFQ